MQSFIESRYPPDVYSYAQLKELVLDGCKIKSLNPVDAKFLQTFSNLTSLSCCCVGLTTLSGFPCFPTVTKLELQDNLLTTSPQAALDRLPSIFPAVRVLRLGGNKIKSAEELINCLKPLAFLEVLDIEQNPFVRNQRDASSRSLFFSNLPQLKSLDNKDALGVECNDAENEEDDEDDEDDDVSSDEDTEVLKSFYEKSYEDEDDDEEDFNPTGIEEDDEDIEEEEEENESAASSTRRSELPDDQNTKRRKL